MTPLITLLFTAFTSASRGRNIFQLSAAFPADDPMKPPVAEDPLIQALLEKYAPINFPLSIDTIGEIRKRRQMEIDMMNVFGLGKCGDLETVQVAANSGKINMSDLNFNSNSM